MLYVISIVCIASLAGFLWALRSALLDRVRIENELSQAMSKVQHDMAVDIDVAVNNVTLTLKELAERMGKIESVVRVPSPELEEHDVANPYLVPSNLRLQGFSGQSRALENFQPLQSDALVH